MSHRAALRTSAILFALLYGIATFLPVLPEGTYSDASVLRLVNDDATPMIVAGYALAAAGLVFLWFAGLLAEGLQAGRSALPRLMGMGGAGYGIILMIASTYFSTIAMGRAIGELPTVEDPFLVRTISNQGFHLVLVPGLLCAGLLVLSASLLGRRTGQLPGWASNLGYCVLPLLLLGATWVPQFLVPIWAIVVAFAVRERKDAQPELSARSVSAAM
jgi:hypothetical protein